MACPMEMTRERLYKGIACVIPFMEPIVRHLIDNQWAVNVLDWPDAFDVEEVCNGVKLIVGDATVKHKSARTPLADALHGASRVYIGGQLADDGSICVHPGSLTAILTACGKEGVSDIRFAGKAAEGQARGV